MATSWGQTIKAKRGLCLSGRYVYDKKWLGWKVVSLNSGALRVFVCKIYIKYVQLLAFIVQHEINEFESCILLLFPAYT